MLRPLLLLAAMVSPLTAADPLHLTLRSQARQADGSFKPVESVAKWETSKTAIIVCDMRAK